MLAKGDANIVTQVGKGDGYQALLGKANIVTRWETASRLPSPRGGQPDHHGRGWPERDGRLRQVQQQRQGGRWHHHQPGVGDYNLNTKVGDGLNVAVMKGKGNANVQIGDGLDITAAYARHNGPSRSATVISTAWPSPAATPAATSSAPCLTTSSRPCSAAPATRPSTIWCRGTKRPAQGAASGQPGRGAGAQRLWAGRDWRGDVLPGRQSDRQGEPGRRARRAGHGQSAAAR
ncbi:hypothetical protein H2136_06290 [Aeromonas hydrophila]|uniref:Uncharacterized protein n=1 Tax=Aeromonas hydrophila TaxID=644 RepID=A0A926FLU5_AERHY|nr:hypothetical protein [Aeromonas hydrophila]